MHPFHKLTTGPTSSVTHLQCGTVTLGHNLVLHLSDDLGRQLPHSELSGALVFTKGTGVLALIRQCGFLDHQLADLAFRDQGEALVLLSDLLAILRGKKLRVRPRKEGKKTK